MAADFDRYLPDAPRDAFDVLGDPAATDDQILASLKRLLGALTPDA